MLLKGFFNTDPFNPNPYWDNTVLVNLSGAQKFDDNTIFPIGKYRVEIAPGGWCNSSGVLSGSNSTYINIEETIPTPFIVRAYCGGNATTSSVGTNLYSGDFKVNGITSDTQSHGVDVNHIFGAGGGNYYTTSSSPLTQPVHGRGGGNCLGDGSISTIGTATLYFGAGSCLHFLPVGGVFGTDYIRAYHVAPYAQACGSAYGGGAAGYVGSSDGRWGYRGGNSPYGTGATTSYTAGTGIGAGGTHVPVNPGMAYVAGGARFDGTQWIDVPGDPNNTKTSLIKITWLGL